MPVMAGNWKMHGTVAEARQLAAMVAAGTSAFDGVEVLVAPPFTALAAVAEAVSASRVALAAQNMHWAEAGAFTGEVSPLMVREWASHVIVGHSERRHVFGETDEDVHRKVHAAFDHGLVPIVCLGETEPQREAGETDRVVRRQLAVAVDGLDPAEVARLIVAYEPVWAIGTGRACDPIEAQRVMTLIRSELGDQVHADSAEAVRLLYGGSVNPANVALYLSRPDIDGCLVGGASLDAAGFVAMVRIAAECMEHSHGG